MTTIAVRPFDARDQPAILDLMHTALGERPGLRRSQELFAWKHFDNPFGRSLMLVAEDDEGIVGFRAFMRWELDTPDGERLRCVRAVDTATHPRARRRGVFRTLTNEAVVAAGTEGVDLIFNTPNPRSGAGYVTMGWREVGRIGALIRPRLRGWLSTSTEIARLEGGSLWDDRRISDRRPQGLRTPRTKEYLTWRYKAHPTAGYRVIETETAAAVLRLNTRRGRRELVVSDLFGNGAAAVLRRVASDTDAAYLIGWFGRGSPERSAALRAGMLPIPRLTTLTLFCRPLRDLDFDVHDLGRWDLTFGDLELL